MFLILLNTNLLRSLKDTIVPLKVGAETLSFIRLFCEMPLLLIFISIYRYLMRIRSQIDIFRYVIIFYTAVVILFSSLFLQEAHIIEYPISDTSKIYVMLYYWPYSLSYAIFDLWPVIAYINFFWELSNRLFSQEDAKHIYPRYQLVGQSNIIISGLLILFSTYMEDCVTVSAVFKSFQSSHILFFLILSNFFIIYKIYTHISPVEAERIVRYEPFQAFQSLLMLRNKFFQYIFLSLFSYYSAICLLEVMCLHYLKIQYPQIRQLIFVNGVVLTSLGVLTIALSLVSKRLISYLGITQTIQILPWVLFILGNISFLSLSALSGLVVLLCFLIAFNLSRAIKYTMYDSAKEIAYIPLTTDMKQEGKNIDMLGVGCGRFMGHLFPIGIFSYLPRATYETVHNTIWCVFIVFAALYIYSNIQLKRIID